MLKRQNVSGRLDGRLNAKRLFIPWGESIKTINVNVKCKAINMVCNVKIGS